jgi:hypothetical protein
LTAFSRNCISQRIKEDSVMADDRIGAPLAEQLERGQVIYYPRCPFPVPEGEDHRFLLEQRLGRGHKNIGFDPHTGKATGFHKHSPEQADRLRALFAAFSQTATGWLAGVLPGYARGWQLDRISYRPEEESTRRLGQMSRNDLLHVDAFPSRPTNGWRILRLFANVNPSEPRVWITADNFAALLARFGREVGLPTGERPNLGHRLREAVLGLFQPARRRRSAYDAFMLRLHNFLKANAAYQATCAKREWHFAPGSAWMVITDTATHAALRGRYALEHSYFLSPATLALPAESPAALLGHACGREVLRQAA